MSEQEIENEIQAKGLNAPRLVIELDDESAWPFVRVSQPGAEHEGKCIAIDGPEWPFIRDAIQQLMNVAQGLDADELPPASDGAKATEGEVTHDKVPRPSTSA